MNTLSQNSKSDMNHNGMSMEQMSTKKISLNAKLLRYEEQ
jgi:hypothetical protein